MEMAKIIVTERELPKEDDSKSTAHYEWCGMAHPTRKDRKPWPRSKPMTIRQAHRRYVDLSSCGLCKPELN
jgi:hypothetical protein